MRRSEHTLNQHLDACMQERCYTMHVRELRKLDHQHAIDATQPEAPLRLQVYNQQTGSQKREILDKANYLYTLIPRRHGKVSVRGKKKGKTKKQGDTQSEFADDFFLTQKQGAPGMYVEAPESPRKRPPNMWDYDEETKEIVVNANTAQMRKVYPSMMNEARYSQPLPVDRTKIEKFNSKYYKPSRIDRDNADGMDNGKGKKKLTFSDRKNRGKSQGSRSGTLVDMDADDDNWKKADLFQDGIEHNSDAEVSLHPLLMQGSGGKKPTSLLDQVRGNDDRKGSQTLSPSRSPVKGGKLAPLGAGSKSAMTPSPVKPLLSGFSNDEDEDGTGVVKPKKKWKRVKRRKKGAQTSGTDDDELKDNTGEDGNEHGHHRKIVKKVRMLRKINGKYVDASQYDEEATKSLMGEKRVIRTRTVVKRYRVPSSSTMGDGSDEGDGQDDVDAGEGRLHDTIGNAAELARQGIVSGRGDKGQYESARSGTGGAESSGLRVSGRQGEDASNDSSRSPQRGDQGGAASSKSPREGGDNGVGSSRRSGSPGIDSANGGSRRSGSPRQGGDNSASSSRRNGSPGKEGLGEGTSSMKDGSPGRGDSSRKATNQEQDDVNDSERSPGKNSLNAKDGSPRGQYGEDANGALGSNRTGDKFNSSRDAGDKSADPNSREAHQGEGGTASGAARNGSPARSSARDGNRSPSPSQRNDDVSYNSGRQTGARRGRWMDDYSDEEGRSPDSSWRSGRRYRNMSPNSVRSQRYNQGHGAQASGWRQTWRLKLEDPELASSPSARNRSPPGRNTVGTGRRIPFFSLYRDKEELKRVFLESPCQYEDSRPVALIATAPNVLSQIVDQHRDEHPLLPVSGMLTMVQVDKGLRSSDQNSIRESARSRAIPNAESSRTVKSDSAKCHNEDCRFI